MKIIAFIPVRGESKSIPLKNIKIFCGKPLLYWNISELEKVKSINKIIIATDSKEIKDTVNSFDLKKTIIYDRDSVNAQDASSTESVMLEYLSKDSVINNEDLFILVQATSPFTQVKDFQKAISLFKKKKIDSLLSVTRTKKFFWRKDGKPINYNYKKRPRRQDFEGVFEENGAFYINRVGNILRDKNRLSGKIGLYEMPEYSSYELDEPEDWIICEKLMQKNVLSNQKKNKLKIKLFITDVDGVLTDAGMYYSQKGDEFKKFNTHDGMGFELLRKHGVKTVIITSEKTKIVGNRAKKLKIDYLYQGIKDKLSIAKKLCKLESINLNQIAYIGDDINDLVLLAESGIAACPQNAVKEVKNIPNIIQLKKSGGDGAVREYIEYLIGNRFL